MGKGGKQQQPKRKQPEPESEEEVQGELQDDQEEDIDNIEDLDAELSDKDQELLERINNEIMEKDQPLKLTWAAIHKLKEQEKELNQKMDEQMRKIQAKFDVLRAPLIHKIAKIASGHPVEKEIYTHHQLTKDLNINKHKPQAIPGFWRSTLESVGFAQCQEDSEILDACTRVECDTHKVEQGENEEETIKALFEFADNEIITNKQLKIEIHRKGDQFTVKARTPIKFKGEAPENSSFRQMFNPELQPQKLYAICQDLQRAYNNSVFHYFYEGLLDQDLQAIEGSEEQEDDDDDEESEEEAKPIKNKPSKKNPKQAAATEKPIEKPQCKNQ